MFWCVVKQAPLSAFGGCGVLSFNKFLFLQLKLQCPPQKTGSEGG